jgi:hypothetical protein
MDIRTLTRWLLPMALGTVLVLPPPGHDSMTLGPNGTTFTYRSQNGDSIILPPRGGAIFDYDNGGGNHTTLVPGQLPVFTYGDGGDDGGGEGDE